jgi:hypothetical protein
MGELVGYFEADSETAFFVVAVEELEGAYFGSIAHVVAYAGAGIVIAYSYNADGFAGMVGELAQVYNVGGFFLGQEIYADRQVAVYHLIHQALYFGKLFCRGFFGEKVVALTLFTLNMGISRTPASKHPHHRLVEYMLRRMHRRIRILLAALINCGSVYHVVIPLNDFPL